MENSETAVDNISDIGLTEEAAPDNCITVTCDAFEDGVAYAGFVVQTIGMSIVAIIVVIAFYLFQRKMSRRKRKF